jgi:hypothetical protein
MFRPDRYVVLGHSIIQNTNTNKIVPAGVTLVFLSECGYTYSRNRVHGPILKNERLTNNFLKSGKVLIYGPGSTYRDQVVSMPQTNKVNLLHGIYKLPVNLFRTNRPPRELLDNGKYRYYTRPNQPHTPIPNNVSYGTELVRISGILDEVRTMGGGTVICSVCRGIENVAYSNILRLPKRTVFHKRRGAVSVKNGNNNPKRYLSPNGGVKKYMGLRRTKQRGPYMNAIKKAVNIKSGIPPPTGAKNSGLFARILGIPRL